MLKAVALLIATAATTLAVTPYDPTQAFSALYYCKTAYCHAAEIQAWNCPTCSFHSGMTDVQVFVNSTAKSQAFVGFDTTARKTVVAFRGTSNLANWITDLTFVKIPYPNPACPGCKVHKGFWDEWLSFSAPVMAHAAALNSRYGGEVLVTGHSLGAAVSILAGIEITRHITKNATVYNFGEPRVGDPAFAAYAHTALPAGRQFRVTHRRDPVPHVPPESFGFLHTPHELWYDNEGNTTWKDCADSGTHEDPKCSDSILPIDVDDHLRYLGIRTECVVGEAAPRMTLRERISVNGRLAELFGRGASRKVSGALRFP